MPDRDFDHIRLDVADGVGEITLDMPRYGNALTVAGIQEFLEALFECERRDDVGAVLVRGQRAPIVGRVCMDLTLVDVTEIPAACDGDEVVLLGSQGTASISLQEVAQVLDTIPYVVMTGAGSRVQRRYPG